MHVSDRCEPSNVGTSRSSCHWPRTRDSWCVAMDIRTRSACGAQRASKVAHVTSRPADLPDFERPPVVEVNLGIEFGTLRPMRAAHVGLFWSNIRGDYPTLQEQPALNSAIERFDEPGQPFEISFEFGESAPPLRAWLLSPDSSRLLQIQNDRFIHNWRRMTPEAPYPRYETVRDEFGTRLDQFASFVEEEQLGTLDVVQAEVNYVNELVAGEVWEGPSDLGEVVAMWKATEVATLRSPEEVRVVERHRVETSDGAPARLYISLTPRPDVGGKAAVLLTLTVRGRPTEGKAGIFRFFDFGRELIVRTFADVTTPAMHALWGRTN